MRQHGALLAMLLLAGCAHPAHPGPSGPSTCEPTEFEQVDNIELTPGVFHLNLSSYETWNGRYVDLQWSDQVQFLKSFTVRLSWNTSVGQSATLAATAGHGTDDAFWEASGRSPLVLDQKQVDARELRGFLRVGVDPGTKATPIGNAIVLPQDIRIVLKEVYVC